MTKEIIEYYEDIARRTRKFHRLAIFCLVLLVINAVLQVGIVIYNVYHR